MFRSLVALGAFSVGTLAACSLATSQACTQELQKFEATDQGFRDKLGFSLAIDGPYLAAGANGDDDLGQDAGAVYLFDVASGQQMTKLFASDGSFQDEFGYSVGVSGSTLIAGGLRWGCDGRLRLPASP